MKQTLIIERSIQQTLKEKEHRKQLKMEMMPEKKGHIEFKDNIPAVPRELKEMIEWRDKTMLYVIMQLYHGMQQLHWSCYTICVFNHWIHPQEITTSQLLKNVYMRGEMLDSVLPSLYTYLRHHEAIKADMNVTRTNNASIYQRLRQQQILKPFNLHESGALIWGCKIKEVHCNFTCRMSRNTK